MYRGGPSYRQGPKVKSARSNGSKLSMLSLPEISNPNITRLQHIPPVKRSWTGSEKFDPSKEDVVTSHCQVLQPNQLLVVDTGQPKEYLVIDRSANDRPWHAKIPVTESIESGYSLAHYLAKVCRSFGHKAKVKSLAEGKFDKWGMVLVADCKAIQEVVIEGNWDRLVKEKKAGAAWIFSLSLIEVNPKGEPWETFS